MKESGFFFPVKLTYLLYMPKLVFYHCRLHLLLCDVQSLAQQKVVDIYLGSVERFALRNEMVDLAKIKVLYSILYSNNNYS